MQACRFVMCCLLYTSCIVEFNNRIFGEAARLLHQKLEREIEESSLVEGSFDVKIEKAYADIGQRGE